MRIFACMASSLDGRIGPANSESFVPITSRYDMNHLKARRDEADGILFGAATFRTWPNVHIGHRLSRKPHHFILSNSLDLDVNTPLFQAVDLPLTLFTSSGKAKTRARFPAHVQIVQTPAGTEQIPFVLEHIQDKSVNTLLVEGGGTVIRQLINAQVLAELYLTVAPLIIGQSRAPGLLGGGTLTRPPGIKVLSSQLIGDELYLHLELSYS